MESTFNGRIVYTAGSLQEPPCHRGIRQASVHPCECGCDVAESLGLEQDTGSTCTLHDGQLRIHVVDLRIPGRGLHWTFERTYRSGIAFDGPLGRNWEFNYNRRLVVGVDGHVSRMDGYGRADCYEWQGGGSVPPRGFYTRLVRQADGSYIEQDRHRNEVCYSAPDENGIARMTELRDRHRNTIRFEHDPAGQLIRALDTFGRQILYRYDRDGRLVQLEDFVGRRIILAYDVRGDLSAVTRPAVDATPNGNDFPYGKTTRYRYTTGYADDLLNHRLTELVAPNQAEQDGPSRLSVEYDFNPASPNRGRVVRQLLGGENANGIRAGGSIVYAYSSLPREPRKPTSPVSLTEVTDRNGNRTAYYFDSLGNMLEIREFASRRIRDGDPDMFSTTFAYNSDDEILIVRDPQGRTVHYTYDSGNPDRLQQGNLLSRRLTPDSERGSDQSTLVHTYTYEPIYSQPRSSIEPRENDRDYIPPIGGATSPERYTTLYLFDYQEGDGVPRLAALLGMSEQDVRALLNGAGLAIGLGDLNDDGRTDQCSGDVVRVVRPTVTLRADSYMAGLESSTSQPINETLAYNSGGQLTRHRDAEGNVTLFRYYPANDPDGDGQDINPEISSEPLGYLQEEVHDAETREIHGSVVNSSPARLRRSYFYDRGGNVIRQIDGRGIATEYAVNALNQIVQVTHAADVSEALCNGVEPKWRQSQSRALPECTQGMTAFRYRTRIFFDANDNVVRVEAENRDSNNQAEIGDWLVSAYRYDMLDNLIERRHQVSVLPFNEVVYQYRYDRNQNRVLDISPLGTLPDGHAGRQAANIVSRVFDERDLLYTSTRGGYASQFRDLQASGDIVAHDRGPEDQQVLTEARSYDRNRNLTLKIDAAGHRTTYLYDGFDRRVSVIDAMGNQSYRQYDPADNVVRIAYFGSTGCLDRRPDARPTTQQPLTAASFHQPLLRLMTNEYDELSRLCATYDDLFVARDDGPQRASFAAQSPADAARRIVTTRYEYDRRGRLRFTIGDDGGVWERQYDGADRLIRSIDATGNETHFSYDEASNVIEHKRVDFAGTGEGGAGPIQPLRETFAATFVYDAMNRRIRATDDHGRTTRWRYDSRGNLVFATDAQPDEMASLFDDPLGVAPTGVRINGRGHARAMFYDGLGRRIGSSYGVRTDPRGGDSDSTVRNDVVRVDYLWDAADRLVAISDDGSAAEADTGPVASKPRKHNITRYRYDHCNRLTDVTCADGTVTHYEYEDDDLPVIRVDRNGTISRNEYDALNRLIRRRIQPATSTLPHPFDGFKDPDTTWQVVGTILQEFEYDGLSRLRRCVDAVPSNGEDDDRSRVAIATFAYDSLDRVVEEAQNGRIVTSRWHGVHTRHGLQYPSGLGLELTADALGRLKTLRKAGTGGPLVQYHYVGPTRLVERLIENGTRVSYLDESRSTLRGYDSLGRSVLLRHVGQDDAEIASLFYQYDRADNIILELQRNPHWSGAAIQYDAVYRLSSFSRHRDEPVRWQLDGVGNWLAVKALAHSLNRVNEMNEYIVFDGVARQHDDNGNLIEDGRLRFEYDFANRLCAVHRKGDGVTIARYRYDALGRRIARTVRHCGPEDDEVIYVYDGWREIEEVRAGSVRRYIYGASLDELVAADDAVDSDTRTGSRVFFHADVRGSIIALTDQHGSVIERYSYHPYGAPQIRDGSGSHRDRSVVRNSYLFAGRRHDPETGLYYFRNRYLEPATGRFITRDVKGMWSDRFNFGNGYTYAGNDPVNRVDPLGLAMKETIEVYGCGPGKVQWGEGAGTVCTDPVDWGEGPSGAGGGEEGSGGGPGKGGGGKGGGGTKPKHDPKSCYTCIDDMKSMGGDCPDLFEAEEYEECLACVAAAVLACVACLKFDCNFVGPGKPTPEQCEKIGEDQKKKCRKPPTGPKGQVIIDGTPYTTDIVE